MMMETLDLFPLPLTEESTVYTEVIEAHYPEPGIDVMPVITSKWIAGTVLPDGFTAVFQVEEKPVIMPLVSCRIIPPQGAAKTVEGEMIDLKEMNQWLFMTYTGEEEAAKRMGSLIDELQKTRETLQYVRSVPGVDALVAEDLQKQARAR